MTWLAWGSCFIGPGSSIANRQNSRNQANSHTVEIRPQPGTRGSNSGRGKIVGSTNSSAQIWCNLYYCQHCLYSESVHACSAHTSALLRSPIALPKLKSFFWTPKIYSCLIFRPEIIYKNMSRSVLLLYRQKIMSQSLLWRCEGVTSLSVCVSGRIHPQSQAGFVC